MPKQKERSHPLLTGRILPFVSVIVLLLALFLAAVKYGSIDITWGEIFSGLFGNPGSVYENVRDTRFPRIFIAMLGGAATAVSGTLLQAVMRNPLADPGIIGINAGANLCALLLVTFLPGLYLYKPLFACLGGLIAFAIVYSLSWKSGLSPLRIVLVGVAVSAMFTGISDALQSFSNSGVSILKSGVSQKGWSDVRILAVYGLIALVLSFFTAKQCDLLSLSDETASALGVKVNQSRLILSVIAVFLASVSTAVIGPISFLGLIVPHIARLIVGSEHKVLLPFTALAGAFTLLLADTVGRLAFAPYEISAAVLMAVLGGPFFIILLRRSDKTYGTN